MEAWAWPKPKAKPSNQWILRLENDLRKAIIGQEI